jgi:hypothetical protein
MNASSYDRQAEEAIPAEWRMISGCHDSQTSADVSNVGKFQLPNPMGKAGGACTAALLSVLYDAHKKGFDDQMSWVDVLRAMRSDLQRKGFDQVPQLTSSRCIDVTHPFKIVNSTHAHGTKRAVLIGINYVGQQGQLSGCHNDVKNMYRYLQDVQGFQAQNMTVLMDDGQHSSPTYSNIINAYKTIVYQSQPGDTVFLHYSGHGGRVRDTSGDEDDGYDETLIPVDFQRSGQIVDDDLLKMLVKPMAKGVLVTSLMDCCHSGTVLDLPYRFTADGDVKAGMQRDSAFNFGNFLYDADTLCCLFYLFDCLIDSLF